MAIQVLAIVPGRHDAGVPLEEEILAVRLDAYDLQPVLTRVAMPSSLFNMNWHVTAFSWLGAVQAVACACLINRTVIMGVFMTTLVGHTQHLHEVWHRVC